MAGIILTKENFEAEVVNSDKPVLVDFFATWCGPCKMLEPVVAEFANKYEGSIKVGKIDVDQQQELAVKFGVASIPTVIVFKDGQLYKKSVGFMSITELEEMLK